MKKKNLKQSFISRKKFFDKQVHMNEWKQSMSGDNELEVISVLENLGYKQGTDFVRQHPIGEIGIVDIAFVNEKVAVEVDGGYHQSKKQIAIDRKKDEAYRFFNWAIIRVPHPEFFGRKAQFFKHLIHEVVDFRRQQYLAGGYLTDVDINFEIEKD